ncbi:MAG: hypothetical protein B6I20_09825 [Bacteroidetes bacterium 4572_117]|nr:MAG: hypothetical protein B6I20_09825 [Bacteroidetes bacterium 4572_117]
MDKLIKFAMLIGIVFNISNTTAQRKFAPEKPKLIVNIVVEQMRYDLLQRYWPKFSNNGFKKMVNEGTLCKNASYNYMITESAPGYATIASGTTPSNHGIVSDYWYKRLKSKKQFCVDDKSLKNTLPHFDNHKYSPKWLIGSTIGDELRISNYKQSKVIGVSLKNYAAILSSGHMANQAYWFDDKTAYWTSSPFYVDSLSSWVNKFNEKKIIDLYVSREWNTLLPISKYKESLADNNSYEVGFKNGSKTFPHDLKTLAEIYGKKIIKYTPYGNTYTKDFAIAAIVNEKLGKDDYPDLINIGFSTSSYVNELFGVRSVELEDVYLRLDKDIAHLLNFLDDFIGKEKVLVVLTSDRGTSDNQMFYKEIGMPTGKFNSDKSISVLESYLKAIYGRANWVKSYNNRQVYLNQLLIDASKLQIGEVQIKAAQFLNQFKGIANATTATILQTTSFTDGIHKKFQNSYNLERSGDIIINLEPGWIEVKNHKKNTAYFKQSSPYRYDAHVPLIWYGWKINSKEIIKPVHISDIAPTISNLLNIAYPTSATGTPIEGLIN